MTCFLFNSKYCEQKQTDQVVIANKFSFSLVGVVPVFRTKHTCIQGTEGICSGEVKPKNTPVDELLNVDEKFGGQQIADKFILE